MAVREVLGEVGEPKKKTTNNNKQKKKQKILSDSHGVFALFLLKVL